MSTAVPNQSLPAVFAASLRPEVLLVAVARSVVVVAEGPVVFAGASAANAVAAKAATVPESG